MITVYHVIVDQMGHEYLEIASWLAQLFIVLIALIAAYVARGQLKEMGDYRRQRVRIANAQLLMELDNRWDSIEMLRARSIFNAMKEAISAQVGTNNPRVGDDARKDLVQLAWQAALQAKRTNVPNEYRRLMSICGFFETVGLMVHKDYIMIDDVLELFLGPVVDIERCFGGHIEDLAKEAGVPDGLYRHALILSEQAAKR